jgi:hypothetical protein
MFTFYPTFNIDNPETVRALLDQHGIRYRSLEPRENNQPLGVHIVDLDGSSLLVSKT